ncbi:MAG: SLBB domain-containing protein [Janthinobacterium lividum]
MKPVSILSILLLITICFTSINLYAHISYANVKIDEISNVPIRQLIKSTNSKSVSYNDPKLEQVLSVQGIKFEKSGKLKLRIDTVRKPRINPDRIESDRLYNYDDTINNRQLNQNTGVQTVQRDAFGSIIPKIFGEDLFRNNKISFEPNLRLATPKGYVIGPDDELLIDVTGDNEASYNLKVNPEGTIRLQYVGIIAVAGLTIEQATSKIRTSMVKTYPGLTSGRTNLAINLGNIRSIRVTIVGEAVKPGTYTLSSLSSVFNALYASGGPNNNGSFRKIQLIRNNKVVSTIDIYDFLLKGIQNNVHLQDQDVINIPVYKTRVGVTGEVKRPALFEVLDTESLQQVLNFAGGFTSQAYSANIKVLQNTSRERKIIDVKAADFATYKPVNGDTYTVETILNRFENQIEIQGAVFRPGKFELEKGLTVKALISEAEGLREDAFLNRGYVSRLNPDNTQALLYFDVSKLLKGTEQDILLQREDKVTISSIFDLRDEYRVEVQGEVRYPGIFNFADNMNIEAAIQLAGGFKEGATPNRIEISRRTRNSDPTSSNAVTAQIFTVNVDAKLKITGQPFILQPYDIVTIRGSEGYEVQKLAKIEGEVLFPGLYTIQRKDEKISDLIKRAGGLTAMAFPEGASLKRPGPRTASPDITGQATARDKNRISKADEDRERLISLKRLQQQQSGIIDTSSLRQDPSILRSELVGINLTQILAKPASRYDLLLEDGDVVRVPKQLQTIRVSGEVLKPTNIVYKPGKSVLQYISESGGFTYNAKRHDIYVEYANGSIKSTKKVLFFRFRPSLKPGAEIFVPKRALKERIGLQGIIGIASAITSLAVIIIALLK